MLKPVDAYAVRRALVGQDVSGLKVSPETQILLNAVTTFKPSLDNLGSIFPPEVAAQIFAIDPNGPPPVDHESDSDCPPLPMATAAPESWAVGGWLDEFVTWAARRSPLTPRLFLEGGALYTWGLLVAGRACVPLSFGKIYPHLYVLWVAITSRYAKSTGLGASSDFIASAAPHLLLSSANTPEVMFFKLAGNLATNFDSLSEEERKIEQLGQAFGGNRGVMVDEASRLFLAKDYLQGLTEIFLELYDGKDKMSAESKKDGKLIIKRPRFSILAATTPAKFRRVGEDAWGDGLLARFALLTPPPDEKLQQWVSDDTAYYDPPPRLLAQSAMLEGKLKASFKKSGYAENDWKPLNITLDKEAFQSFTAYDSAMRSLLDDVDERLHGNYGRMAVQALKIAQNLALMDWANDDSDAQPRITAEHWQRGQHIAEQWRQSSHRLLAETMKSEDQAAQEAVMMFLHRKNQATKRDIQKGTKIRYVRTVESALSILMEAGQVGEIREGRSVIYEALKGTK